MPNRKDVPTGHTPLLLDLKRGEIGCVLLQAAYGGDRQVCHRVPTEKWFTAPTPDMAMYSVPNEEVEKIVKAMNRVRTEVPEQRDQQNSR